MDATFERAVKYVADTSSMQATNDQKLNFYKWYKQVTVGDVVGERPGMLNFEKRAKYDSWASVKGMSKKEAMELYIKQLDEMAPNWNK
ncbi:bifunctional Acyl-CoA-binding protein [Babesia duncani]|uniref:Bifunctional Acyl-CoA-binding protein n=1 Tax=Babesia duncani TaxID=323732 RepID=A0AAD9PLK4_9APIC|nr:bifunctional Acyl-CoA-binding protein [Babesia duncani]